MYDINYHLTGKRKHRAPSGGHGKGSDMHGRKGKDLMIKVPPGTIVRDRDTGLVLRDLKRVGDKLLIAKGGKGGRGNARFKTAIRQQTDRFDWNQEIALVEEFIEESV